jgi:hypothetical protein
MLHNTPLGTINREIEAIMIQTLSDSDSMKELESHIEPAAFDKYQAFKHLRVEAAFIDRVFVIYEPTGLNADRTHRAPKFHGQIRVTGFRVQDEKGAVMLLEDMATGATQVVDYVPALCFNYDFFVAVPPFSRLRWEAAVEKDGSISRRLTFGILLKTRSRAAFYSAGATCAETPNSFRQLYPNVPLNLMHA